MKCPHCTTTFHDNPSFIQIGGDSRALWVCWKYVCPQEGCGKMILILGSAIIQGGGISGPIEGYSKEGMIYPKGSARPPVPPEVTNDFAEDYTEACLVLENSPKASAALSSRCLQHILRENAGIKKRDLASEIEEVITSGGLPSYLTESVDAIRVVGNFAAHPTKSTGSGEIVEVEPGEAEWNLDVLELLFDFYFVQPEVRAKKREAINQKLKDAGKPPMK